MLQKITYNKQVFYVDLDNQLIFDFKKQTLSQKTLKQNNFKSKDEALILFKKLIEQSDTRKDALLNEIQFDDILQENLLYDNKDITRSNLPELRSGLNYKIVKSSDIASIINLLSKIKQKDKLISYKQISFNCNIKKNAIPSNIKKYLSAPLGSVSKEGFSTLPIAFSFCLNNIGV
jgi:hypothetical protein